MHQRACSAARSALSIKFKGHLGEVEFDCLPDLQRAQGELGLPLGSLRVVWRVMVNDTHVNRSARQVDKADL